LSKRAQISRSRSAKTVNRRGITLEEGGVGDGTDEGVAGEAGEEVKLQVVGGLGVAVAVEQSH
jgi:hypothetical protein